MVHPMPHSVPTDNPLVRAPGRPRSASADVAIQGAVIDLLDEQGLAGITFEAVAARAGVAKSTVYRRWPTKEELVFDAVQQLKGPLPELAGVSVRDDLLRLMQNMRTMWVDTQHGRVMRRLIAEGDADSALYQKCRERLVTPRQSAIRAVLDRGIAAGQLRADLDLAWVIDLFGAPIILSVLTHRGGVEADQVEFTVDLVLSGLRP
jgi:AcrR family transcriptional regulator